MTDYNEKWCEERHDKIEKEFDNVWAKLKNQDNRLWSIIVLQLVVLGGIIGVIIKM